jgi:hypothetical protein
VIISGVCIYVAILHGIGLAYLEFACFGPRMFISQKEGSESRKVIYSTNLTSASSLNREPVTLVSCTPNVSTNHMLLKGLVGEES